MSPYVLFESHLVRSLQRILGISTVFVGFLLKSSVHERDVVNLLATAERAGTLQSLGSKKEQLRASEVEATGKLEAIGAEEAPEF